MPAKKKSEILPPSVTVVVTKSDIRHGEQGSCQRCPVARALQRRFPDTEISVGGVNTRVDQYYRLHKYRAILDVPAKVSAFIISFDSGKRPKPFRFTSPLVWNRI